MIDTHKRTIAKTITWRVIATTTTIAVIYMWTGDAAKAFGAGLVANAFKTIFYYIHERLWNRTHFGRQIVHSGDAPKK